MICFLNFSTWSSLRRIMMQDKIKLKLLYGHWQSFSTQFLKTHQLCLTHHFTLFILLFWIEFNYFVAEVPLLMRLVKLHSEVSMQIVSLVQSHMLPKSMRRTFSNNSFNIWCPLIYIFQRQLGDSVGQHSFYRWTNAV